MVTPPSRAGVVVLAESRAPIRGAWNVEIFHGLGDKGYTLNPIFLQRGRYPRLRTALNLPLSLLRLPAPFLRAPVKPGRRASRYQQLNAYGPRWADLFEDMVRGAVVSRHGHVALNETEGIARDPEGPLVWLPTWDNRRYLGGRNQSSLETFAADVQRVAARVPVLLKVHPLTERHGHAKALRRRLADTKGVTVAPAGTGAYQVLEGARGLLTDTSSLGFEAFCSGLPVAIARNPGVALHGLHAELAERASVFAPGDAAILDWAESPSPPADDAWARDLLSEPRRSRNDAFAAALREKAVEMAR